MTDLKNTGNRASHEFIEALDKHRASIGDDGSRNDYIIDAIIKRVEAEGGQLPSAKAPHGVRTDTRLNGWRSRLYRDRYQLIAVLDNGAWQIEHLHEADIDAITQPMRGTLRAEMPQPMEITVYAPEHIVKADLQHDLFLEILAPDWAHLWDR